MNTTLGRDTHLSHLKRPLAAYQKGSLSRRGLLEVRRWEIAVAEHTAVSAFLAEVQKNQNLGDDLVDEVTLTSTENIQNWAFPEDPDLYEALPETVACTFPELIQSSHRARGVVRHVRNMLFGFNVRLNLRSTHGAIGEALRLVMNELALLERACDHVGAGILLAPQFPGEEDRGRPSWSSPGGAPLSDLGQKRPEFTVNHAEGISGHSSTPQLVTERSGAGAAANLGGKKSEA
jgi:hypothetical protein